MRNPEALLISSVLLSQDWKIAVSKGVNEGMFHIHQEEWAWIEQYKRRHRKLPTKRAFREQYPEFTIVKDVDDTAHFAEEVKRHHAKQQLLELLDQTTTDIMNGSVENAILRTSSDIIKIAGSIGTYRDTNVFTDWQDVYKEVEDRVKLFEERGRSGIPTGIPTIDELTGGYQPSTYNVVAARLGCYKSWTMQWMAANAVMNGYNVVFDALEQSRAEVTMRIHSLISGIVGSTIFNSTHLMQGRVNLRGYKDFCMQMKEDVKGRLHVCDTSGGPIGANTVAAQIEKHNPDLHILDYFGLMDGCYDYGTMNTTSVRLKQISSNYQTTLVIAQQLNRANGMGDGPAGAEALAGTDNIARDADTLTTIARYKKKGRHVLICSLEKNRNGDGGLFYMHTNPGIGSFREISQNEADDLFIKEQDEADARAAARRDKE